MYFFKEISITILIYFRFLMTTYLLMLINRGTEVNAKILLILIQQKSNINFLS